MEKISEEMKKEIREYSKNKIEGYRAIMDKKVELNRLKGKKTYYECSNDPKLVAMGEAMDFTEIEKGLEDIIKKWES